MACSHSDTDVPAQRTQDPFFITGPALISFSGGRTSAYMLWRILQAHNGRLPNGVVVVFANTGREMPATYDFVRDVERHWSVPVTWVEFRHALKPGAHRRHRWAEIVTYETASRDGEPFAMLLESKKIVPDPARRFCTQQLKVQTIRRYLRDSLGMDRWINIVGFRADESERVFRKVLSEIETPDPNFTSIFPLYDAGLDEWDVHLFWQRQNFALQLDADGDGGNCDGCFMFSKARLLRMWAKYPERMRWWEEWETRLGSKTMVHERSYRSLREAVEAGHLEKFEDHLDGRFCDEACGV